MELTYHKTGNLIKQKFKSGIQIASGTALYFRQSLGDLSYTRQNGRRGRNDFVRDLYGVPVGDFNVRCRFGAMMPIIGMFYGEKDFSGVRILIKYVLRFALTLSGSFVAFAIIFPQIILPPYNVPAALIESDEIALRLFSISLSFAMIFAYTKIVCKNSGGKLDHIFLLERIDPNILYDVSFKADEDNAVKIYSETVNVLKSDDVAEGENLHTEGVMLLKSLAGEINYNRVLSLNQTLIEI